MADCWEHHWVVCSAVRTEARTAVKMERHWVGLTDMTKAGWKACSMAAYSAGWKAAHWVALKAGRLAHWMAGRSASQMAVSRALHWAGYSVERSAGSSAPRSGTAKAVRLESTKADSRAVRWEHSSVAQKAVQWAVCSGVRMAGWTVRTTVAPKAIHSAEHWAATREHCWAVLWAKQWATT